MKEFPKLEDAEITLALTQPQMKLLLASVSYFHQCVDANTSIDCEKLPQLVKSMQQHAMKQYKFSLPYGLTETPHELASKLINLIEDAVQDRFFEKRWQLADMFRDEVNKLASELDPEIFTLDEGERIELSYNGMVTG